MSFARRVVEEKVGLWTSVQELETHVTAKREAVHNLISAHVRLRKLSMLIPLSNRQVLSIAT